MSLTTHELNVLRRIPQRQRSSAVKLMHRGFDNQTVKANVPGLTKAAVEAIRADVVEMEAIGRGYSNA